MFELIRESTHTARKEYVCMACEWLNAGDPCIDEMTFAEKREYVKMRRQQFKIQPGQRYLRQVCKDLDGKLYTYRANPVLHQVCTRLEAWD